MKGHGWVGWGWTGLLMLCAVNINMSALSCGGGGGGGGAGSGSDTYVGIPGPWSETFDGSNPLDGWMYWNGSANTAPSTSNSSLWSADGTPMNMPGGAYKSGSKSLNYNNGTNYNVGMKVGGAVTPKINISNMQFPVLSFQCNYETETTGNNKDKRWVKVGYWNGNNASYWVESVLATNVAPVAGGACGSMGAWHEHVVTLQPSWGDIRVAFIFDSIDSSNNNYRGWFVDDVQVAEFGSTSPGGGGGGSTVGGGGLPGGSSGGTAAGGGSGYPGGGNVGGAPIGGTPVYSANFDGGIPPGWQFSQSVGNVGWAFDATPSNVTGGAFTSAPNSLNYNNGTDYVTGTTPNSGWAQSPTINLAGTTNPALGIKCNYQAEDSIQYDKRVVQVSNNNFTSTLLNEQLAVSGGSTIAGACALKGTWHAHAIPLQPSWGTIQVRFSFDTVDGGYNNFAGWFIDDFVVVTGATGVAAAVGSGVSTNDNRSTASAGGGGSKKKGGGSPLGCMASLSGNGLTARARWIGLGLLIMTVGAIGVRRRLIRLRRKTMVL